MGFHDDYDAKYIIWARNPKVVPLPKPANLPEMNAQRFDSYEAFNAWKNEFLEKIAVQGGLQWTN